MLSTAHTTSSHWGDAAQHAVSLNCPCSSMGTCSCEDCMLIHPRSLAALPGVIPSSNCAMHCMGTWLTPCLLFTGQHWFVIVYNTVTVCQVYNALRQWVSGVIMDVCCCVNMTQLESLRSALVSCEETLWQMWHHSICCGIGHQVDVSWYFTVCDAVCVTCLETFMMSTCNVSADLQLRCHSDLILVQYPRHMVLHNKVHE